MPLKNILCAFTCLALLAGCGSPNYETKPADPSVLAGGGTALGAPAPYGKWERGLPGSPAGNQGYVPDLRSYDLTAISLSTYEEGLQRASFDTNTIWPENLPDGFFPQVFLELGKNPGLGLRSLHQKGITGEGVSIAIIDQTLLQEHTEYRDNLRLYETLHNPAGEEAQMHGAAVASLAVGTTTGVAPQAELYYIASTFGSSHYFSYQEDLSYMAQAIERVMEINQNLPEGKKIKAVSISQGYDYQAKGSGQVRDAIAQAKAEGILVVTPDLGEAYSRDFLGLGRSPLDSPDSPLSYQPGAFWREGDSTQTMQLGSNNLLVPMDARTYASFTGPDDYAFDSEGGMSWACPWLAGLYALCLQVDPALTPDGFLETAFQTGTLPEEDLDGTGRIVNPLALVESLAS